MGWIDGNLDNLKNTLRLRAFSLMKIPALFFAGPQVIELNDRRIVMRIPVNRRTRNHLKSMYIGVLVAGADCAAGLLAWNLIEESGKRVDLIFKNFHADFLKRVEKDAHFICEQGSEIRDLVAQAVETGQRVELPVRVKVTVPHVFGDEPVAQCTLTLSLKRRSNSI